MSDNSNLWKAEVGTFYWSGLRIKRAELIAQAAVNKESQGLLCCKDKTVNHVNTTVENTQVTRLPVVLGLSLNMFPSCSDISIIALT